MKKIFVSAAELVFMFTLSCLILMPIFGESMVDWGHPAKAWWDKNSDGKKVAKIEYEPENSVSGNTRLFYERRHVPVRPSYWLVLAFCLFLAALYPLYRFRKVNYYEEEFINKFFLNHYLFVIIGAQAVAVLTSILVGMYYHHAYQAGIHIKDFVPDQELAGAILKDYENWATYVCGIVSFCILVFFDTASIISFFVLITTVQLVDFKIIQLAEMNTGFMNTGARKEAVIIWGNSAMELRRFRWIPRWKPWPVAELTYQTLAESNFGDFASRLIEQTKRFATHNLTDRAEKSIASSLGGGEKAVIQQVSEIWQERAAAWVDTNSDAIRQKAEEEAASRVENILKETSSAAANRIRKEISAEVTVMVTEHLRGFWAPLLGNLRAGLIKQQYASGELSSPLPDGAKFFISKGDISVLVVEQKPMKRTVRFTSNFLNDERERAELAFPYFIFVLRLKEDCFTSLYTYYRNEPLRSLDDELYLTNLPNTGDGGGVCLGYSQKSSLPLDALAQEVIGHFWQSQFNNDFPRNFNEMRERDRRFANVQHWEKYSKENPLFVLGVAWQRFRHTPRTLIQALLENNNVAVDLVREFDRMAKDAICQTAQGIGEKVSRKCAELNLEKPCANLAKQQLEENLKLLAAALAEQIASEGRDIFSIGGEDGRREVVDTLSRKIKEKMVKDVGELLAQNQLQPTFNVWNIMRQLDEAHKQKQS